MNKSIRLLLGILHIVTVFVVISCSEKDVVNVLTKDVFTAGIEGPVCDVNGDLYVVNHIKEGTIGKVNTATGKVETYCELPKGSTGNGLRIYNNHFFVADYTGHNILQLDPKTKKVSVFAHEPLKMNQPNDLTVSKTGVVFCSDPNWQEGTGQLWKATKENGFILIDSTMGTTNGIELNPDNTMLYVNESKQLNIWTYDVDKNFQVSNKTLFYHFKDGGMDGMRCDNNANLFVARYDKGCVVKLSPQGKVLKKYLLKGQKPTNVAFSPDQSKLYVTLQDKKWVEVITL